MISHGRMLTPTISYNVIGEIKGIEFPDEIILVGGHLDSWDVGEGARGCNHAASKRMFRRRKRVA